MASAISMGMPGLSPLDMLNANMPAKPAASDATKAKAKGAAQDFEAVFLNSMFQQMLHELMRQFGAEPERTLMVGDTTHDLQMARNAGVARIGVSFGAHGFESFAEFEPLTVAHSTRELHDWLLTHA